MALFFPLAKTLLLMMCVIQGNVMVSIIPDYVNQRLESRKINCRQASQEAKLIDSLMVFLRNVLEGSEHHILFPHFCFQSYLFLYPTCLISYKPLFSNLINSSIYQKLSM